MKSSSRKQPLLWAALLGVLGLNAFMLVEIRALRQLVESTAPESKARIVEATNKADATQDTKTPAPVGIPSEPSVAKVDGKDKTSSKRRVVRDPCRQACDALGNCALEPEMCLTASTTTDHKLREGCLDGCRSDPTLANRLEMAPNCKAMIRIARAGIKGFTALCGSNETQP